MKHQQKQNRKRRQNANSRVGGPEMRWREGAEVGGCVGGGGRRGGRLRRRRGRGRRGGPGVGGKAKWTDAGLAYNHRN